MISVVNIGFEIILREGFVTAQVCNDLIAILRNKDSIQRIIAVNPSVSVCVVTDGYGGNGGGRSPS